MSTGAERQAARLKAKAAALGPAPPAAAVSRQTHRFRTRKLAKALMAKERRELLKASRKAVKRANQPEART